MKNKIQVILWDEKWLTKIRSVFFFQLKKDQSLIDDSVAWFFTVTCKPDLYIF